MNQVGPDCVLLLQQRQLTVFRLVLKKSANGEGAHVDRSIIMSHQRNARNMGLLWKRWHGMTNSSPPGLDLVGDGDDQPSADQIFSRLPPLSREWWMSGDEPDGRI